MDSFGKHKQLGADWQSTPARGFATTLSLLLLAFLLAISGCGGGSSQSPQNGSGISGNWQFNLAYPAGTPPPFQGDPSAAVPNSILQGSFLVQQNGSVTGQAVFSIWVTSQFGSLTECNGGTTSITGTVSGQSVSLTATVGTLASDGVTQTTQTFTLTNGQLSSDNSTIQGGTYSSTAGYYIPQGSTSAAACGTVQSGLTWSANSVPPITGGFQGFFHSISKTNAVLAGQVFAVTGSLIQGDNIGASSATVTGSLSFAGYPCLTKAAVNGQISGSALVLQIFNASSGSDVGQIGGLPTGTGTTTYPVTFNSTSNGYTVQNLGGSSSPAYALSTSGCPGTGLDTESAGDVGNICLAFGAGNTVTGATSCTEPITISPASVTFAAQPLASDSRTRQLITLTNIQPSGSSPLSVSTQLQEFDNTTTPFYASGGDFNGLPNFTKQDTCAGNLAPQQTCTITISFSPQESCPWLPFGNAPTGLAPAKCPGFFNLNVPPKSLLSALLTVTIPSSNTPDGDSTFAVPIKGTGLSAIVPSTPELDFSAEDLGESSQPQALAFTNQSASPVQILSAVSGFGQSVCNSDMTFQYALARPPQGGVVPGLVVAATNGGTNNITANPTPLGGGPPTVQYYCDFDQATNQASFQISSDTCSGQTLGASGSPNDSCTLQITFVPQPDSYLNFSDSNTQGGLDYFLELNTQQCDLNDSPPQPPPGPSNPCEVDSGRFPVELTANPPGSLRMSPAAGLSFGTWLRGATSTPLTITLTNDQKDNLTVNFTGKALTGADYLETDYCPATLSPGDSCALTFTLAPSVAGFDSGSLTIGYNTSGSSGNQYNLHQYIYLRGIGQ